MVPRSEDGLRRAIGEAHRRYTRRVNFREGWRGHLWQGRFASFVMDEPYLLAAARYIELNPVRAGLVTAPSDDRWSSARAHLKVFREHERTGRVLGDDDFQARLEKQLGRVLRRQKPGPKKATPG